MTPAMSGPSTDRAVSDAARASRQLPSHRERESMVRMAAVSFVRGRFPSGWAGTGVADFYASPPAARPDGHRSVRCEAERAMTTSSRSAVRATLISGYARGSSFVDLYWLPLGAGGHSVRFNGLV